MRRKMVSLLLIVCFFCLSGFIFVHSGSGLFSKKYYEVIPFETVSTNAMVVPVAIGGKVYNFQFDTGASTSISNELFAELNLTITDSLTVRDYYNNKMNVMQAILPDLSLGKTKFRNVKVGVIRPIQSLLPFGVKIDGYLGNDVLSNGVVQIDMLQHQLVIANSMKSINVARHHSVDFHVNNQMIPYLDIQFPGTDASEKVMFDTGSANYYYRLEKKTFQKMIKTKQLSQKDILDTLGASANGSGIFGKQNEKEIYVVNFDRIRFVGQTIYNCPAYTFTSGYSSVVGSPFLQLGIVTINYRDQKFYFKPYTDQVIDLGPKNGYKKKPNKESQMVFQTLLKDTLDEQNSNRKESIFRELNFLSLDSLSTK